MTSARRPPTWLAGLRATTVVAGAVAAWGFSFPGQPVLPVLLALVASVVAAVGAVVWVGSLPRSRRHRLGVGLVLVAVVGLAAAAELPARARFLPSAPVFSLVAGLSDRPPAPGTVFGAEHRGPCPAVVGLELVSHCVTVPGGLLLFDHAGSALFDDAGWAYLPWGPDVVVEEGWFERPEFIHLVGDWYAFSSSW
ncbi:hypothetical protein [Auraticoccus monumenti]|uniref:hypothetical protein n=1 Tax=Auraticoccus monumenti TaxID=675864 RepID=UPI0012FC4666|nr:hypothetical protein [Auraticoccus monumenti]